MPIILLPALRWADAGGQTARKAARTTRPVKSCRCISSSTILVRKVSKNSIHSRQASPPLLQSLLLLIITRGQSRSKQLEHVACNRPSAEVYSLTRSVLAWRTMPMLRRSLACLLLSSMVAQVAIAETAFRVQEISNRLTVGYAVQLVDVSEDGKPDIVVVDSDRVVWFENPTWKMQTIIDGLTKQDNVSIAPTDIDGDGRIDFALAADWRPSDTRTSGTLQWLTRGPEGDKWTLHEIGTEPTMHRIRFAALDGDSRPNCLLCRSSARLDGTEFRRSSSADPVVQDSRGSGEGTLDADHDQ